MSGATFVQADRETVWAALHDVDVIASCIPGCRSLVRVTERSFSVALGFRFGPLAIAFDGSVDIAQSDPPSSYCLLGRGNGGRAGTAAGRIKITLTQSGRGCHLAYDLEADAQGPLSNAGVLMLTGAGNTISSYFASRFSERIGRSPAGRCHVPANLVSRAAFR